MNEDVNKNYYPIKLLFDEKMKPFIPLVTVDCVLVQGTDKSAQDLFDERYTKEEVDKIITDLGTLQRLCGTLNTYQELQAIENPKPGDTYIIKNTNTSGNYQEYMYIGTKWEELGPFVDLSNYATHSDVDAKIEAYNTTIRAFIAAEDAGVLEAAKAFAIERMAGAENLDLEVSKTSNVTTLRIYRKDGSIEEVQVLDGEKGDTGLTPNLQVGTVAASEPGSMPSITRSGTNENPYFNFVIPKGEQGPEGPEGPAVPVDDFIDNTSENAVKGRVVKEYIDSILGDINTILAQVVDGVPVIDESTKGA